MHFEPKRPYPYPYPWPSRIMTRSDDRKRGNQDARQAFEILRARWPKAFPLKSHEVRPLANAAPAIVGALGWSNAYARGVLKAWKARESYCRAVLAHPMRINLDGSASELAVDDEARAMAAARLEQIAARKAKDAERAAARKAQEAAETKPPAPPVPLPELAPVATQPEPAPAQATPEPERPRARKLLTLGPAAKDALAKRALGTTEVVATIERRAR